VQIEIRALDRLRGNNPVDLGPMLGALATAAREGKNDLSRLRVVGDYLQYRQNFRPPIALRRILPSALELTRQSSRPDGNGAKSEDRYEIAVDLRRSANMDLEAEFKRAMAPSNQDALGQYLEGWVSGRSSCIWAFNGLYWNALGFWEQATGREYEQALPGGETDARNSAAARELILELFNIWDGLAARHALPEDLQILEIGVGNGNQAKVFLDEFVKLDREHNGEYYRRLHYLMGDYSPHVLERARDNVRQHADHTSSLVLDARTPGETLGFLRGKAFLIYISNVYDNLPTDEIVRIGGQLFRVEVRAYIPNNAANKIAQGLGVEPGELPALVQRLLQLGPDLLSLAAPERFPKGALEAVEFWRQVWEALRLQERYVPIEGLDTYELAPGLGGEILRPLVEANGDIRMHLSNGAAASFLDSLPLLHPFGVLQCHDIFVTDLGQYKTGFRGPGKYDGSVVNWVNGPLLQVIGKRRGFDVELRSFAHRTGSNIITLNARMQE
jgi:hypothetical protein